MDTNKIKNIVSLSQNGLELPKNSFMSAVTNSKIGEKSSSALHNAAPAGFEQTIDTLTQIKTDIIKQKFYTVDGGPAAHVPVKVGEGAFTNESLYYTNFQLSDDFGSGIMGQGTGTRKAKTEVGYDSIRLPNFFWAKELEYSLIEVQQAAQNAGSAISLIAQKEEVQKTNWDLGIQKTAFLGQEDIDDIDGLLSLSGITTDTATLTKPISAMTSTEINAFAKDLIKKYFVNSNKTAMPDTFLIPTTDWLGLSSFVAENQPLITKADFLLQAFKMATNNPNFKITSVQYADKSDNNLPGGVNRYTLYKNDSRTLEMNIPIDYTSTSFGSANNFDFASVAYGQFSGVIAKRPLEIYYLDHTVTI